VDERRLLIEEGTHTFQVAALGGFMDRMILGRGRRRETPGRIDHLPAIISCSLFSPTGQSPDNAVSFPDSTMSFNANSTAT
jgi:hypothetical protein